MLVFMAYATLLIPILQHQNLYKINVVLSFADQIVRLGKSILSGVIGLALLSFFSRSHLIVDSRLAIFFFAVFSFVFLAFIRLAGYRKGLYILAKRNIYHRLVVIIGAGKAGRILAANLSEKNPYGLKILGFLDNLHSVGAPIFRGLKVLGHIDDLESIAEQYALDEIIVCVEDASHEQLMEILDRCQRTQARVKIASPLYDVIPARISTERYGEVPIVGLAQTTPGPVQEFYKRMFDVICAAAGLVLLSPVFVLVAIAIKITSNGSVLYRQMRIGKDGEAFTFYKFRSMIVGSDDDETRKRNAKKFIQIKKHIGEGSTKIVDESKITSVGRILRKTSIDELPQLFNVLRGDMSLVGPRPCLPYEWEHYEDWHKKRLSVMPGCTGVWQVSGRSSVGFEDMVILDLYYIQNASLIFDFQLILKTIPVMVFGKGAK
jgi:undecaprenyl-phosphate galactose phosphotransferase